MKGQRMAFIFGGVCDREEALLRIFVVRHEKTIVEDYDMVWRGGPCFMLGKPFILKPWTPRFMPLKMMAPGIWAYGRIMFLCARWNFFHLGLSGIASGGLLLVPLVDWFYWSHAFWLCLLTLIPSLDYLDAFIICFCSRTVC